MVATCRLLRPQIYTSFPVWSRVSALKSIRSFPYGLESPPSYLHVLSRMVSSLRPQIYTSFPVWSRVSALKSTRPFPYGLESPPSNLHVRSRMVSNLCPQIYTSFPVWSRISALISTRPFPYGLESHCTCAWRRGDGLTVKSHGWRLSQSFNNLVL